MLIPIDMKMILPILILLANFSLAQPLAAAPTCQELFQKGPSAPALQKAPKSAVVEAVELRPGQRFNSDAKVFRTMADRILERKKEFMEILAEVDNYHGAVYEITQVIRTLRGVELHELEHLKDASALKNVAVYGSTNIPLYTLLLHAVLPASTGAHVWFRTPMASRETYVKAMNKLREIMPEADLSHIHILTEPADVQYDNFRKQHVLGLNRKGTRSVRAPADMVIFTGNPKTGDEIRATIATKLEELKGQIPDVKTVFLQFGSGLNPVIVTELAQGAKLEPAIQASIQAIRINSSQDCIAPKFYMVHYKIANTFIERLKSEIGRLQFGPRNDPSADYSSLTFAEGVESLSAFRAKWASYLINPEAQIDPATKRVDPHVFVLPFEKFHEVELVDHYAPFIIMFRYSSKDQLETVANDPRVKSRAMFASVFGDSSNTEMVYLRKLFEDNFHSTILNQSVFVEESGNFAFGGYSEAASSVTLFRRSSSDPELKTYTYARPLLFSREAKRFFGTPDSKAGYAQIAAAARAPNPARLRQLIDEAKTVESTAHHEQDWTKLVKPQLAERPRGLKAIRDLIAKSGFHRVVVGSAPRTDIERSNDRLFYGENVLYTGAVPNGEIRKVPGVVIHPSWIGDDVRTLNSYRGDLNPHLGFGFLHPYFFSSKKAEAIVAESIWPGSMPRGISYLDLNHGLAADFQKLENTRVRLLALLNSKIHARKGITIAEKSELVKELEEHLDSFFALVNRVMPHGAFIKNFNEATTGDLGNQITSYSQNSRNYALEFVERFAANIYAMNMSFTDPKSIQLMHHSFYETGSKMITKLLSDPNDLLIQQRVKIKKTDLGMPTEIRVDFVDGEAVHSRARYTHEYLGADLKEAEAVLNTFFEKAPSELRHLSGGADIAKLEDGTWVFIEFNFGSNSGTLSPELFPIESNLFMSRLTGRTTPLIEQLDTAFKGGVPSQRAYLKTLRQERDKWQKSSIQEMSIAETAKFFRDRYLDEWRKSPSHESAERTLANLEAMIKDIGSKNNRDLPLLVLSARNFINRELMERNLDGGRQAK